jgi:hypothetical protein
MKVIVNKTSDYHTISYSRGTCKTPQLISVPLHIIGKNHHACIRRNSTNCRIYFIHVTLEFIQHIGALMTIEVSYIGCTRLEATVLYH